MKNLVKFAILFSSFLLIVNAKSLIGELLDIFFADLEDPNEYSQFPNSYQGYQGQNQYQGYQGQNQYQGYNQGFPMYQQNQGNQMYQNQQGMTIISRISIFYFKFHVKDILDIIAILTAIITTIYIQIIILIIDHHTHNKGEIFIRLFAKYKFLWLYFRRYYGNYLTRK